MNDQTPTRSIEPLSARGDPPRGDARRRAPSAVSLGAFVEAVATLTDDPEEIIAVTAHFLRTRGVPMRD